MSYIETMVNKASLQNALSDLREKNSGDIERIFEYFRGRDRQRNTTNIRQLYYYLKKIGVIRQVSPTTFHEVFKRLEGLSLGSIQKSGRDYQFNWYYRTESIGRMYYGRGTLDKTELHPGEESQHEEAQGTYASIEDFVKEASNTVDEKPKEKLKSLEDFLREKPDNIKKFFQALSKSNYPNGAEPTQGHMIIIDLRSDFRASLSLPKDLTYEEAQKIIKFVEASIVDK